MSFLSYIRLHMHNDKSGRFQVLPNVNDECCQLTMSPDDVDSVFFKYHLIKAESARLIVACKRNFKLPIVSRSYIRPSRGIFKCRPYAIKYFFQDRFNVKKT
jgi:hypothetical protein